MLVVAHGIITGTGTWQRGSDGGILRYSCRGHTIAATDEHG